MRIASTVVSKTQQRSPQAYILISRNQFFTDTTQDILKQAAAQWEHSLNMSEGVKHLILYSKNPGRIHLIVDFYDNGISAQHCL